MTIVQLGLRVDQNKPFVQQKMTAKIVPFRPLKSAPGAKFTHADSDKQVIKMWLHGKAATTQSIYPGVVKQFQTFVGKSFKQLTLEDLQLWQSSLTNTYSTTTIKNKTNIIKSLLSFAQKIDYCQFNVGAAIKSPVPKDSLNERIMTQQDAIALIDGAANERDKLILSLMFVCGLRVSEVCNLTWNDLKPNGDGGQLNVFGKGSKTRTVLIPLDLYHQLSHLPKSDKCNNIFVSRTGRKLTRNAIHYRIKKAAENAGINEKVSSHWLRHSHATTAIENGCDLHLLQQSLGHSSLAITGKYLHARPNQSSSQFVSLQ